MSDLISKEALTRELVLFKVQELYKGDLMKEIACRHWADLTPFSRGFDEGLDYALQLIGKQPTIQPQGIDKDRLIEELEAIKFDDVAFSDMREGWNLGVKKAIRIVKKQPTTDGWIPVSSGELPENGQRVLTTETFSWDSPNDRCVREAYYFKEKFAYYSGWEGEGFYRERNSCHEDYHYSKIGKVHAWRPLPQPYKESE